MSRHPSDDRPRPGARQHGGGGHSAKRGRRARLDRDRPAPKVERRTRRSSPKRRPRKPPEWTVRTDNRSTKRPARHNSTGNRSTKKSTKPTKHGSTENRSTKHRPTKSRSVEQKARSAPLKKSARRVNAPPPAPRPSRLRSGTPRRRLVAALVAIAVVLIAIVVRVGLLQTSSAESFRSAGVEQWTRTAEIPARRGTIFDRNGTELAMSVPASTISINPRLIVDGEATVETLDQVLDLDEDKIDELLREIEAKERGFVYVQRQAGRAEGRQISLLDLPGVTVEEDSRRELTSGDSARSVIGSVDIDLVGTAGLELQYDDVLSGKGGSLTREIAPGGRTIAGSETITAEPVPGEDLILTIDRSIQHATEQLLIDRVASIPARGAQAIVMDTDTGEIYAMASVRTEQGVPKITSGNYAAVEAYEPGSVAKVLTIAGALDSGAVTRDTGFEVPWRREYYDVMLSDSHQHATEWMDVWKILVVSSNIGTIEIQRTMGSDVHHEYMRAFGWGEPTALDFPSESPGELKPYEDMWGSEKLTPSYGQGVATTPVQLISAINVVANGGNYVAPRLVRATVAADGEVVDAEPSETRRVISEEAAQETSDIMRDVVCRGTATRAQVDGLTIAGKTGTAFKAADNGTYWTDEGTRKYYASFVGYFPAEDPQVTILVSVDEPAATNERFGGTAAAPVFADLAPLLMNELGIQPPAGSGCPEE